ncbi:MAG TPA: MtrB/PioB family decaheme-associated outer membrane protein [Burkholderiales bacterium]|nr:MtrB/PioB family decaheme-associated outer membrane protein [Burkholderiales bacterium]
MHVRHTARLTGVCAAVLGAISGAYAAEADFDPTKPVSKVTGGIGYATDSARRFGEYNGLTNEGVYPLIDLSIVRRDETTGTWMRIEGRSLGLDNRSALLELNRQGRWGAFLDFTRIPRHEPYTAVTSVTGIGSGTVTVPGTFTPGTSAFELKTTREVLGAGVDYILAPGLDMSVRFRNDHREGNRIWGRGTTGGGPPGTFGNFEFTPEPINQTMRQLDVLLSYSGDRLQLTGGYYGTMFNNQFNQLDVVGGVAALATPGTTAFTPLALPPDNHSHQVHLSGSYGFTNTTRATFKTAYATARQNDTFPTGAAVPLAPGVGNNLDGKVDTTLAQMGVISRPLPKLTLRADFRYEDRDDKTPVVQFFTAPGSTATGVNEPRSIRTTRGSSEASYMLPYALRLTGGIEYEEKKRNTSDVRIVSYREKTEEWSYRVELRRSMSETLTGAIAYVYSDRDGSPFITTTQNGGALGSNLIAPIHLADRKRDKVRVSSNWNPIDALNVQFFADWADDRYSGRDGSGLGPRKGEAYTYSIDAGYTFSDKWQANVWYTRNKTRADQSTCEAASAAGVCPNTAADPTYNASVTNESDNVGIGFRGKPNARIEIGGDLTYSDIKDTYFQMPANPPGNAVPTSLPNITTRLTRLSLFGKYALDKRSGLRLNYIFDRFSTNDWTWPSWVFIDGTRLTQDDHQKVHFIGLSYYFRWQ